MHERRRCLTTCLSCLFLLLRFTFDHIFGPKKDDLSDLVFVFSIYISNVICDLVLYLKSEGFNSS